MPENMQFERVINRYWPPYICRGLARLAYKPLQDMLLAAIVLGFCGNCDGIFVVQSLNRRIVQFAYHNMT